MRYIVESVSGPGKGRNISLKPGDKVVVGRTEWSDICMNEDQQMSARHFAVESGSSGLKLIDQGSTNGTQVNGEFVKEAPLYDGDMVVAGATSFRVRVEQAQPGPTDGGAAAPVMMNDPKTTPDAAPYQGANPVGGLPVGEAEPYGYSNSPIGGAAPPAGGNSPIMSGDAVDNHGPITWDEGPTVTESATSESPPEFPAANPMPSSGLEGGQPAPGFASPIAGEPPGPAAGSPVGTAGAGQSPFEGGASPIQAEPVVNVTPPAEPPASFPPPDPAPPQFAGGGQPQSFDPPPAGNPPPSASPISPFGDSADSPVAPAAATPNAPAPSAPAPSAPAPNAPAPNAPAPNAPAGQPPGMNEVPVAPNVPRDPNAPGAPPPSDFVAYHDPQEDAGRQPAVFDTSRNIQAASGAVLQYSVHECKCENIKCLRANYGGAEVEFHPSSIMALLKRHLPLITIVHFQKGELEYPKDLTEATPLLHWLPDETARQFGPVMVPPTQQLDRFSVIDELWDKDGSLCFYARDIHGAMKHLVELVKYNMSGANDQEGIFGYCWPSVLANLLLNQQQDIIDVIFANLIDCVFMEVPGEPGHWQMFGTNEHISLLNQNGFTEIKLPDDEEPAS